MSYTYNKEEVDRLIATAKYEAIEEAREIDRDYMYMMEILLLIDEIESPVLIELIEPCNLQAEA